MADASGKGDRAKRPLDESEIRTETRVGRRSVLTIIGGAGLAAGAVAMTGCVVVTRPAPVNNRHPRTSDGDPRDPAGGARTGYTDSDPTDGTWRGRNYTGITDGDGGNCMDPTGFGHGNTGITDSDGSGGGCTDAAGRGRGA
jgi:hypothetical protein